MIPAMLTLSNRSALEDGVVKYKVAVLEDDAPLREIIVESLRYRDFDASGYSDAETLLAKVFDAPFGLQSMPDLVVVDLHLEQEKMQGLTFVAELAERDVPSEILVTSGIYPSADLIEAVKMGAGAWVAKPFSIFDFVKTIESLSEVGRKRRLYRLGERDDPQEMDLSRQHRPVFLSYSNKDKKLATGLRRNLETKGILVWYAPTTLDLGDLWRSRIQQGIDQASIFVALLTDSYQASPSCIGELMRFHRRIELGSEPCPLILPVLNGLSAEGQRNHLLRPILENYQYVDISMRFVDGLTELLARIQNSLSHASVPGLNVPSRTAVAQPPKPKEVA